MGIVNLTKTIALAAVATLATSAGAATISATSDKATVGFGEDFTVTVALSGFASTFEVDAVEFLVDFDSTLFEYVSHAVVDDGTEFLNDNQQAGYILDDSSAYNGTNRVGFSVADGDLAFTNSGSQKASGDIGSITLRARNLLGIGSIDPKAGPLGNDMVFFDIDFFEIVESDITGGISFSSASVEVVPEPASAGVLLVLFGCVSGVGFGRAGRKQG